MPCLVGIDNGLTVTKAVVFDADGTTLSVARRRVPHIVPAPRHIERDMDGLWKATAEAIAEALAASGRLASDVAAVAATAHGDGVYLLDADKRPLGNAVLSLDSRAGSILSEWEADGTSAAALSLSGQKPHPSAPSALLAWMARHEPERFARIAHVLAAKDWLRFCLTGTIGTDLTEASTSFTNVARQRYDEAVLDLFGLGALRAALPPVSAPHEIVGSVTAGAAALTGLAEGTPVAAGIHDVTASSLGIGGYATDTVAVVAGTYSINEIASDVPRIDGRWLCRNGIVMGEWHNMAISPASSANYDWFLDTLCGAERQAAEADGRSIHAAIGAEVEAALSRPSTLLFHPYLYGSPHGPEASAGFVGLRAWHDRGDMLRAVIEGIAFNHRVHVDALRTAFAPRQAKLTGGISRSPLFAQIFADAFGIPVIVTRTDEAAAWGAALCAGAGAGLYASPRHDPRDIDAISTTYTPDPLRSAALEERYRLHCDIADQMAPLWPRIEALAPDGAAS